MEKGADVNQRYNDCEKDTSTTALHIACMEGHNNIAEILMNYGADVDALHGKTILITNLDPFKILQNRIQTIRKQTDTSG